MVTDTDRLAAEGAALEIAGHTFHVRYTPRSLKDLEARFGSIVELGEALSRLGRPAASGEKPVPLFETVYYVLALGLRHEKIGDEPVSEDWLLDNSDSRQIMTYSNVAFEALVQALPEAATPANPTTPSETTASNGSPGGSSSGSGSLGSGSRRISSGTR